MCDRTPDFCEKAEKRMTCVTYNVRAKEFGETSRNRKFILWIEKSDKSTS